MSSFDNNYRANSTPVNVYVNFLSDEGEDRVKAAYTQGVWGRLVEIKTKYDPGNIFRMNQNIKPLLVE